MFKKNYKYSLHFMIWIGVAVIMGVAGGAIGSLFHYYIEVVTEFRMEHTQLLYFLPLAGISIVFIYHRAGVRQDPGTNLILESTNRDSKVPLRLMPLIIASTILTHLFGGSAGREGAALQVGGCIGSNLGELFRFNDEDKRVTVLCGMSAVFSAMFGTPVAATVFSMEVVRVGTLQYSAFVPCILGAVIAQYMAQIMGAHDAIYTVELVYDIDPATLIKIVILGVICGVVAMLFCVLMHKASHFMKHYFSNAYVRIVVGACIIILLSTVLGTRDYNGAGTNIIELALSEKVIWYAFALKMLYTAISIGSGFKGGEIVPTLFIGATLGNMLSPILGLPLGLSSAVGMIAVFCGAVNAPLTSILLGVELFGTSDIVVFAIACAISYVTSGYFSLYSSQMIIQDKLRQKDIFMRAR